MSDPDGGVMRRPTLNEITSPPVGCWYAQVVDGDGNGLAFTWGSVPELVSGSGTSPPPPSGPAGLTVVVCEAGRFERFELPVRSTGCSDGAPSGWWRFGGTLIRAERFDGQLMVTADLDVPAGRVDGSLTGRVRLAGPVPAAPDDPAAGSGWTPLCVPAFGTVMVCRPDSRRLAVTGRARHGRLTRPVRRASETASDYRTSNRWNLARGLWFP